ncbi:gamma-glutamyl-gamma-aminobutyrate hydrolase family protein [soil metagenome]
MNSKPVIGITPGPETIEADFGTVHRYRVSTDYALAVEAAGGVPIILPLQSASIPTVLELVDGLLFSGGADIDPMRYGDPSVHPSTYGVDKQRDDFELELITSAIAVNTPMLCICRGIQVLNVALGGTLVQDIADEIPGADLHRQYKEGIPADQPIHDVRVTPGSLLEQVYGTASIPANSLHHQSAKHIGSGLVLEGQTEDGIVEAVSYPGASFVLGVQWHPEMMHRADSLQMKPFEALVTAASLARLPAVR